MWPTDAIRAPAIIASAPQSPRPAHLDYIRRLLSNQRRAAATQATSRAMAGSQ